MENEKVYRRFGIFGAKALTLQLADDLLTTGLSPACIISLDPVKMSNYQISGGTKKIPDWCASHGIPCILSPRYDLVEAKVLEKFESFNLDIALCVGWQRLIPEEFLKLPKEGVFGWHGSGFRFPNGRGRSPLNWSIRLGLECVYHNCFKYAAGVDNGPVFSTQIFSIDRNDYISDVQSKVYQHILESSRRLLANDTEVAMNLTSQPSSAGIEFPKLGELDGWLQPERHTAKEARDICRSCSRPFPGAYILNQNEKKIRLWDLELDSLGPKTLDGSLVVSGDDGLYIKFLDGWCVSKEFESP